MAKMKLKKDTNQFIKSTGMPAQKSGQYVMLKSGKGFVYCSATGTEQTDSVLSEADLEKVAMEVLDEFDGAWKRLADL